MHKLSVDWTLYYDEEEFPLLQDYLSSDDLTSPDQSDLESSLPER